MNLLIFKNSDEPCLFNPECIPDFIYLLLHRTKKKSDSLMAWRKLHAFCVPYVSNMQQLKWFSYIPIPSIKPLAVLNAVRVKQTININAGHKLEGRTKWCFNSKLGLSFELSSIYTRFYLPTDTFKWRQLQYTYKIEHTHIFSTNIIYVYNIIISRTVFPGWYNIYQHTIREKPIWSRNFPVWKHDCQELASINLAKSVYSKPGIGRELNNT